MPIRSFEPDYERRPVDIDVEVSRCPSIDQILRAWEPMEIDLEREIDSEPSQQVDFLLWG